MQVPFAIDEQVLPQEKFASSFSPYVIYHINL